MCSRGAATSQNDDGSRRRGASLCAPASSPCFGPPIVRGRIGAAVRSSCTVSPRVFAQEDSNPIRRGAAAFIARAGPANAAARQRATTMQLAPQPRACRRHLRDIPPSARHLHLCFSFFFEAAATAARLNVLLRHIRPLGDSFRRSLYRPLSFRGLYLPPLASLLSEPQID